MFKPKLFSSNATCLQSRLTEFFLNPVVCSALLFISQTKQSNECIWGILSLHSGNLYKCKQVACSVAVSCFYSFTNFFILHFFAACLLLNLPFFYTDVLVTRLLLYPPFLYWYICLFVDDVNKSLLVCFRSFCSSF